MKSAFKTLEAIQLFKACQDQYEWIQHCGGGILGYCAKYGNANDPDKSGDGGEAIYRADVAEMEKRMIAFLKAQGLIPEHVTGFGSESAYNTDWDAIVDGGAL